MVLFPETDAEEEEEEEEEDDRLASSYPLGQQSV